MRILFQGDSITDAGRDKRNYHDMGNGYPKYASAAIAEAMPEAELEFINLGIGGNRSDQLFDRIYPDAVALRPDVISILIGVNDVWHRYSSSRIATSNEQYELNYRSILTRLKNETDAKIVMLAPYLLDAPQNQYMKDEVAEIEPIVRRLADEFADVFIPLDELFQQALKEQSEPLYYSSDAVHPNENGARFIGKAYAEAVLPLLRSL